MSVSANEMHVNLPDGSVLALPKGSSAQDLAANIGSRLAKAAVAATINGKEFDLSEPIPDGATVAIITADSEPGRHVLRHSTAHLMAQAVVQLFPGTKFSIGPAIEDGFYYDFELPDGRTFSEDDL
ncbi:MAG: TGS domain-containing protein, partial [Ilumatobacteraceae bacterium]